MNNTHHFETDVYEPEEQEGDKEQQIGRPVAERPRRHTGIAADVQLDSRYRLKVAREKAGRRTALLEARGKAKFLRTSVTLLGMFILASITSLLIAGYVNVTDAVTSDCAASGSAKDIIYYDEVLTQSATAAAYSGDTRWIERYNENVPLLDATFAEISNFDEKAAEDFFQVTGAANDALIDIETNVINAVIAEDLDSAQNMLFGDEYVSQKAIYLEGVRNLNMVIQDRFDQSLRVQIVITILGIFTCFLAIPMLILSVRVVRKRENHAKELEQVVSAETFLDAKTIIFEPYFGKSFLEFSKSLYSADSLEFLYKASPCIEMINDMILNEHQRKPSNITELKMRLVDIHKAHLAVGAVGEINISSSLKKLWKEIFEDLEYSSYEIYDDREIRDIAKALNITINEMVNLVNDNLFVSYLKSDFYERALSEKKQAILEKAENALKNGVVNAGVKNVVETLKDDKETDAETKDKPSKGMFGFPAWLGKVGKKSEKEAEEEPLKE